MLARGSLGAHVHKKSSKGKNRKMHDAIAEEVTHMKSYNINDPSVQIFVTGPKTYKETLSAEEKQKIARYIADTSTQLVIHGAYVDRPWSNIAGAIHNVKQELRIGAEIGATGVIIHLSSGCVNDVNFKAALSEIANIELPRPQILWLEINSAKPSNFTFETPEKINKLFDRIASYDIKGLTVGLCIDTAHLFACGMSLETYDVAKKWIEALPKVPIMMHLNDSASTLGSGIDKHASLCHGQIWSKYHPDTGILPYEKSGLNYLMEWADSGSIMTILERNDETPDRDLALISKIGHF